MVALMIGGVLLCGLAVVAGIGLYWMSTYNRAVMLENKFNAIVSENKTSMDNMWKTIQQKYQIKSDYSREMVQLMNAAIEGRKGGSLFKSTTEAMPGLDASIYKDVMASIEGKRDMFKRSQDMQIEIKREHDNIRTTMPSSIFVGSRPELKLQLVTSTRTDNAFATGKDDDVHLGNQLER